MKFKTIVKDPKVLEQYFHPLFLNLKEGECLEDYRQNKVVDEFLNAIPKTYEAEDLKAFYEKTGIKVEHQRFLDYWSYLSCNPSGSMPELDEMIAEINAVLTEKLEDWEEHWMKSILDELERCREYMDERNETLIKEYVQRIYDRYC